MVRLTTVDLARTLTLALVCGLLIACTTTSSGPDTAAEPAGPELEAPVADSPGADSSGAANDEASSPALQTQAATLALLQQSARAEQTGSLPEAMAYAERAVRIEPRRADLWTRLATLELLNGDSNAAIQYANKAVSLAGDRTDWLRDAWLVIADALAVEGDNEGARRIREQWQGTFNG
jgi:tetratricopeptide (TPR) repeat protein